MKKSHKIDHVMHADKFTEPFISFVEENFDSAAHHFIISLDDKHSIKPRKNITQMIVQKGSLQEMAVSLGKLYSAEKIILHGLFVRRFVYMLFLQPWLLKKCYWVMWGGDLYYHLNRDNDPESNRYEQIRARVIRKIGHFVTYVKGDYELAKKWYGVTGQYHECLMYPSNTYKGHVRSSKEDKTINILVGNSADPSNNHIDIFNKISSLTGEGFLIYCPLSYGVAAYREEVAKKGSELFGDKFVPLVKLLSLEQYMGILSKIDVAVFAHKRQQGMGNVISLLGMGKKVFMRKDVSSYMLFEELGIKVFDIDELDFMPIEDDVRKKNQTKIDSYFSKAKLIKQWKHIFQG